MNFQQLQFVREVVRTASFSRAAEICCVAQPTLSNAVANLERELGAKLFARNTRSVRLTDFGTHLLPIVESVLGAQQELKKTAAALINPELKLLRIGLSPLVNAHLINLLTEPFLLRNPDVEMFYKECSVDSMEERLRLEQVDVIVRPRPPDSPKNAQISSTFVYKDALVYVPGGKVLADSATTTLDEIKDDTFILSIGICGLRDVTLSLFAAAGYPIKQYSGQAMGYEVLLEWSELGIGSAILPCSKVSDRRQSATKRLLLNDGRPAEIEFEAIWDLNNPQAPHIQAFRQHLIEKGPSLVAGVAI